jgi:hypothetical protein
LLRQAFAALGVPESAWTFNRATGQLNVPRWVNEAQLKQQYSRATVDKAARKNGWQTKWKTNEAGQMEAEVIRRKY